MKCSAGSARYADAAILNLDVLKHSNLILKLIFTPYGTERKIGELAVFITGLLAPSQAIKQPSRWGEFFHRRAEGRSGCQIVMEASTWPPLLFPMGLVDPRNCSPPRSRLSMNEEDWPCAEVMERHCGREGVKEI